MEETQEEVRASEASLADVWDPLGSLSICGCQHACECGAPVPLVQVGG